jgi:hypothetical protein
LEEASAVVVLVDLEVEALAAVEPEDHGKKKSRTQVRLFFRIYLYLREHPRGRCQPGYVRSTRKR